VFWLVVATWLFAAVQIVLAARSFAERRPVGLIGRRPKRRAESEDFRVTAITQVMVPLSFAFMATSDLTQRFVWLQLAGICLGIGLVALIVVGVMQERSGH
jgi:hypothetical protein